MLVNSLDGNIVASFIIDLPKQLPLLTSFAFFGKQKKEMRPFKYLFSLANAFEPHICIGVWERGKR